MRYIGRLMLLLEGAMEGGVRATWTQVNLSPSSRAVCDRALELFWNHDGAGRTAAIMIGQKAAVSSHWCAP